MQVLFVLAIPGLVFGFLLQVPPLVMDTGFYGFWQEDTSLANVVLVLVLAPPALLVARVLYIVVDWLSSEPHPDRRAKP
jgi:hypothetical protein